VNLHQPASSQTPLILLGNVDPVYVRVNVDENEARRVRASAGAIGYLRGNKEMSTPLRFVRFEPYVQPKTSLTGDSVMSNLVLETKNLTRRFGSCIAVDIAHICVFPTPNCEVQLE
jgi:hypothetical protein